MPSEGAHIAHGSTHASPTTMVRLSLMMFLQYWPLGTWGVTVGTYIAANTGEQGAGIFSAGFVGYSTAASAIGSLLSPVIVGFLSDRYFAAERLVAAMHGGCALAAWGMHASHGQAVFFLWLLVYFHCFVPAATLTNKIALRHLSQVEVEYPKVRVFGTAGWIGSGLFVGFLWPWATGESIESLAMPLLLGAAGNGVMALYALSLPHTPPTRRKGDVVRRSIDDSGSLLQNRPLIIFLTVSMIACIPSMAYNNYANLFLNMHGYPRPAALMTLGQVSDVVCLWATPWLIARAGLKHLFVAGIIAWSARYGLLAAGAYYDIEWPVYAAILIHGPCYVFIYVVGVMCVDRLTAAERRGTAQGMFALASTGLGHLFGAFTVGFSQEMFLTPEGVSPPPYHWPAFWLVPAAMGLVALVVFRVAFEPARPEPRRDDMK